MAAVPSLRVFVNGIQCPLRDDRRLELFVAFQPGTVLLDPQHEPPRPIPCDAHGVTLPPLLPNGNYMARVPLEYEYAVAVAKKPYTQQIRRLVVHNLPPNCTAEMLGRFFEKYDLVHEADILRWPSGYPKGRGYVVLQTLDATMQALRDRTMWFYDHFMPIVVEPDYSPKTPTARPPAPRFGAPLKAVPGAAPHHINGNAARGGHSPNGVGAPMPTGHDGHYRNGHHPHGHNGGPPVHAPHHNGGPANGRGGGGPHAADRAPYAYPSSAGSSDTHSHHNGGAPVPPGAAAMVPASAFLVVAIDPTRVRESIKSREVWPSAEALSKIEFAERQGSAIYIIGITQSGHVVGFGRPRQGPAAPGTILINWERSNIQIPSTDVASLRRGNGSTVGPLADGMQVPDDVGPMILNLINSHANYAVKTAARKVGRMGVV